jgi:3-deoxy-D-manno-octulosonic-acid transferase
MAFETEIWPGFLKSLRRRGIPSVLVNARFSERSFQRCRRWPTLWRKAYDLFGLILVRAADDMERFLTLGLPEGKLVLVGDCKVDALLDRRDGTDLSSYRSMKPDKGPLFLAGSTHEGEEPLVLQAFREVRRHCFGARLILAPRHPERARQVLEEAEKAGFTAGFFSGKPRDWSILVVDKVGVLFDLYGIADGAFVGGSLVPRGGQNILEPACWGVPLQHGPHMEDFARADEELRQLGAAHVVKDSRELAAKWIECLKPETRRRAEQAGRDYFSRRGGASSLAWSLAEKHIEDHTR